MMLPMSHLRGTARYSASTWSVGMAVCEKSYSRLLVSTWIGSHRQERQEDAGAEHAKHIAEIGAGAHLDVFGDIAEDLRPSITPSPSTARLFSSRMMSADSLAMSTALSTEMPTSAAFSAGPSLMPVAQIADHMPLAVQSIDDRAFWAGETLANTVVGLGHLRQCVMAQASPARAPSTMRSTGRPTRGRSCG